MVATIVAIVKMRLALDASLYTFLQVLSVTLFEKMPLQQAFPGSDYTFRTWHYEQTESVRVLTGLQCFQD